MTMDLFTTQQDVLAHLTSEADFAVYDTELPQASDEPVTSNGYPAAYAVVRFNDSVKLPLGGAVGGARHDEAYSLVDVLCVGPDPYEARELAWAIGGVADILTGYKPVDAGTLNKIGAGNVFAVGDGTATLPRRFIARVSFRMAVNMAIDA